MRRIVIIISLLVAGVASAQDFDLPEVLCYIEGAPPGSTIFGSCFSMVGDQNGDGYDDLLARQAVVPQGVRRVELFYGGEEMDDEPDEFIYSPDPDNERLVFGQSFNHAGILNPNREPYLVIVEFDVEDWFPSAMYLHFYEGHEALDGEPEFSIRRVAGGRNPGEEDIVIALWTLMVTGLMIYLPCRRLVTQ